MTGERPARLEVDEGLARHQPDAAPQHEVDPTRQHDAAAGQLRPQRALQHRQPGAAQRREALEELRDPVDGGAAHLRPIGWRGGGEPDPVAVLFVDQPVERGVDEVGRQGRPVPVLGVLDGPVGDRARHHRRAQLERSGLERQVTGLAAVHRAEGVLADEEALDRRGLQRRRGRGHLLLEAGPQPCTEVRVERRPGVAGRAQQPVRTGLGRVERRAVSGAGGRAQGLRIGSVVGSVVGLSAARFACPDCHTRL